MDLSDFSHWIRGAGLEIVLILIGAVLLSRLVRWLANHLILRADIRETGLLLMASAEVKHQRSLVQIVAWVSTAIIGFLSALIVLKKLNFPLTSIVAPATVLGAAIGFGSQRVVQDLLSGFFLFTERQYGVGDFIKVSPPGTEVGVSGTVEEVTLRTTRLRTVNGEVVIFPNGEIRQVTNLSRNWAQVVLDLGLPIDVDLDQVTALLDSMGVEMKSDPEWHAQLLSTPTVLGIERIGGGFMKLRFVARTLPGAQWDVSREIRKRILPVFREHEITIEDAFAKDLI